MEPLLTAVGNKVAQIWYLQTTQIYYFTVLELRILNWISLGNNEGVAALHSFLEALGENSFSCCLCQFMEAAHILWLVAPFHVQQQRWLIFHSLTAWCFCLFLPLIGTLEIVWHHHRGQSRIISPCFKVSRLARWTPAAVWIPRCHVIQHVQIWGLGGWYLWGPLFGRLQARRPVRRCLTE